MIEPFADFAGFLDGAYQIHGRPVIEPAIVYANLLVPGQELAVHTDVPEFRGANRKIHPEWLLVAMHHSGLFDEWRMPIATAVAWFHDCKGGEFAFYPDGPEAPCTAHAVRFNTALLVGLALCAGMLAAVGIYGVVNYSVVQRTGEIGVRMALGADARDTVGLVIRRAMTLVGGGVVIGIGAALGATRFIEGMLYSVEPTDVVTYVVVVGLALGVGMLASLIPARRATRVDPVVALRGD